MKKSKLFRLTLLTLALCCVLMTTAIADGSVVGPSVPIPSLSPVAINSNTDATYFSIRAAIDEATQGDTIKLCQDVEYSEKIASNIDYALLIDKSITLDLAGYSITSIAATSSNDPYSVLIQISGPVSVTITDSSQDKTGYIKFGPRVAPVDETIRKTINAENIDSLTISGAKIYGNESVNIWRGGWAIVVDNQRDTNPCQLTITDGAIIKGGDVIRRDVTGSSNTISRGKAGCGIEARYNVNLTVSGNSQVIGGSGKIEGSTPKYTVGNGINHSYAADAIIISPNYFETTCTITESTIRGGDSDTFMSGTAINVSDATLYVTNSYIWRLKL